MNAKLTGGNEFMRRDNSERQERIKVFKKTEENN